MKNRPQNPFFKTIEIPDEYFCDREKETERIKRDILNGANIVLKSPRRIGKSSLIKHVFNQPDIKERYNCFYVDIFGTIDTDGFITAFGREFVKSKCSMKDKFLKELKSRLEGFNISYSISPEGTRSITFSLGRNIPFDFALDEIFSTLEKTKKRNLVVVDEFQQITSYKGIDAAAVIRSHTQKLNNTSFIFSGSSTHLLSEMFESENQPFFKSARNMELGLLPLDKYMTFCKEMFQKYGKEVSDEAPMFAYYIFCGETYPMQEIMNRVFSMTKRTPATRTMAENAIRQVLSENDTTYREKLSQMNKTERQVILCLAIEGLTNGLMSQEKIATYNFGTASAVQLALSSLSGNNRRLIRRINDYYRIDDKFLELWLVDTYLDLLQDKFDNALFDYNKEIAIRMQLPEVSMPKPSQI